MQMSCNAHVLVVFAASLPLLNSMSAFKKLSVSGFETYQGAKSSVHALYWDSFQFPVTVKENAAVTNVSFSPSDQRIFAATSSSAVRVYSTVTSEAFRYLSKFKQTAYGGSFRRDGKLLAAGGDDGRIKVFNLETKGVLRVLRRHKQAVHDCHFMSDNVRLVSYSDDSTVAIWDVPGQSVTTTYSEHADYVRTGATSTASTDIFVSGSYDHTVKMYDARTKKSVLTMNHGSPVEDVLIFPSGGAIISAGGQEIQIWDVIGGGRLIAKLSQHHKTTTCLSFATKGSRLLSGSLDKHIKIYDLNSYSVLHTLDFPSPILSLGVADGDSALVVGMADGLLSIQNRQTAKTDKPKVKSTYKYSLKSDILQKSDSLSIVRYSQMEKDEQHDKLLRKFEVSKALDHVMRDYSSKKPQVVVAMIQELIRRGSINAAVAGKSHNSLLTVLTFILKHIGNPNYSKLLIDFTNIVFDVCGKEIADSAALQSLVRRIEKKLGRQLEIMRQMMEMKGAIELLMAATNAGNVSETTDDIVDLDIAQNEIEMK